MRAGGAYRLWQGFLAEESGAAMVEFAIVSAVFFLAWFQLLGFGLFASDNLMAEKATQLAARLAVARPAACTGVPDRILTSGISPAPRFGTNCRAAANTCTAVATVTCAGSTTNATANEIWTRIDPMLPSNVVISDLQFTYVFDAKLGYLGGPYTPMVTVDLTMPSIDNTDSPALFSLFRVISALAQNAGGGAGFNPPQYRVISISLPAEDLNSGTGG